MRRLRSFRRPSGFARLRWDEWRPGLLWLVGLGGLDQVYLRWLRAHAAAMPTPDAVWPLAVGNGPAFYVGTVAATLHAGLLVSAFALCLLVAWWRRRRRR